MTIQIFPAYNSRLIESPLFFDAIVVIKMVHERQSDRSPSSDRLKGISRSLCADRLLARHACAASSKLLPRFSTRAWLRAFAACLTFRLEFSKFAILRLWFWLSKASTVRFTGTTLHAISCHSRVVYVLLRMQCGAGVCLGLDSEAISGSPRPTCLLARWVLCFCAQRKLNTQWRAFPTPRLTGNPLRAF